VIEERGLRVAQVDAMQGTTEMPVGGVEQQHTRRLGPGSDKTGDRRTGIDSPAG
jgi:hypothetical protein